MQLSSVLKLQTGDERFDRLHGWVANNLQKDQLIGALAERVGMSERSFMRHYGKLVGQTQAQAIETMRVEVAREFLTTTNTSPYA